MHATPPMTFVICFLTTGYDTLSGSENVPTLYRELIVLAGAWWKSIRHRIVNNSFRGSPHYFINGLRTCFDCAFFSELTEMTTNYFLYYKQSEH